MRTIILGMTLIVLCSQFAMAQVQQFPYEAVVQSDNLELRSGPGSKYYSTNKLNKGDRVTVHRHDPGGWHMVAPLSNSFSWIPASKVQTDDGTTGVVTSNQVSVRVGSHLEESYDVESIRLSKGDAVQILEQADVATTNGKVTMYKIVSPRGEYRWMKGQFTTPANEQVKQQQDADPFSIPSSVERPAALPVVQTVSNKTWGRSYEEDNRLQGFQVSSSKQVKSRASQEAVTRQRQYLNNVDKNLRTMLKQEPSTWDLAKYRKEYMTLSKLSVHRSIRSRSEQRLVSLKKYQHMKDEYDHFMEVMDNTNKKDKELTTQLESQIKAMVLPQGATAHNQEEWFDSEPGNIAGPQIINGLPPLPTEDGSPFYAPQTGEQSAPPRLLTPTTNKQTTTTTQKLQTSVQKTPPISIAEQQQIIRQKNLSQKPMLIQQQSSQVTTRKPQQQVQHAVINKPATPKFTSAGIIKRANNWSPQTPRYVLVQPNGQLVAFLHATNNINLEQHIGQPTGVNGKRYYRPDLGADLLVINKVTAVKLIPRR